MDLFDKRIKKVKSNGTSQEEAIPDAKKETVMILENLSKNFGNFAAVDKINIEVHEGETIGLVGPNGAGKTTTIKMIAKLLTPSTGRILIRNMNGKLQDLHKDSRHLVRRGFLIDIPYFYNDMTAYQHLRYFATSQHYPKGKIDARINELLELSKLRDWKYKKVKTFSKGMRQKLGIMQAILVDPQIIILDEPTSGLDPKARIDIRKLIATLKDQGKTIFVASHMLSEISEVSDKIALLNHGKIVAYDTIEKLEVVLKTKELECKIFKSLGKAKEAQIVDKLIARLDPYLDHKINPQIAPKPLIYDSEKSTFKIYYNQGKESKVEILSILVKEFESEFRVESFSEPKATQLERIYQEMITDDDGR